MRGFHLGKYFFYETKDLRNINRFWIGIALYFVAHTITKSNQVNFIFFQVFILIGIGLFMYYGSIISKARFENEYQKIVFVCLVFWAMLTVIRGVELNKEAIKHMLFSPWFGVFPYFVPLVMLFPKKLIYIKKLISVLLICSFFYVLYSVLFFEALSDPDPENEVSREMVEFFSKNLGVSVGFLIFLYFYMSKRKLFYALVILFVVVFLALLRARRGLLFMPVAIFAFWYLLYFIQVKNKTTIIVLSAIGVFILISLGGYLFATGFFEKYFELMAQRGTEDTRTNVEVYFYNDMGFLDWIVGRGMSGEYYCPTLDEGNYRDIIETDYLQVILKGGLIYLVLLLALMIPAIFLGLFKSKNLLSKACAMWIVFLLINSYPSTVIAFNLSYIITWVSVGVCFSSDLRSISDTKLRLFFRYTDLFWLKEEKGKKTLRQLKLAHCR